MSDQRSLEERILDEIRKTGYPTEIISATLMQQRGWGVLHNLSYLDDVEGRSREFDVRAYRSWAIKGPTQTFVIGAFLIAECKKSDKPWVFFTTRDEHRSASDLLLIKARSLPAHIFWSDVANEPAIIPEDKLRRIHHYFGRNNIARTYFEPFKGLEKADRAQMIYTAVLSATKATLFHLKERAWENFLPIYYPVVIFNGDLFEARVESETNITLERTNYVQLAHHYIEPARANLANGSGKQHEFLVDVVHVNYLDEYLTTVENEHADLARLLEEPLSQGQLAARR